LGSSGWAATTKGYTAWLLQYKLIKENIANESKFQQMKTKKLGPVHYTETYPFKVAGVKYVDGAMRHLSLKLSASKTPVLPSQNVA
jgi:hypothetical protein